MTVPSSEQPPYSALVRKSEVEVLPWCRQHDVGVVVWAPLNGGWLTGKYQTDRVDGSARAAREPDHFDHRDAAMRQLKRDLVARLSVVADGAGLSLIQLALGFVVSLGRGRVYVQMFSCALSAGSLPRSTAFVPMVQTVLAGLTAPREPEGRDTMRVGDALRVRLPEFRGLTGQVLLSGPEKLELPLIGSGGDEIRVAGLLHAGPYEISHSARKSGRKRWLTVNPVQGESRLTPITEEEQAVLFGRKNSMRMPFGALEQHFSRRHELVALLSALVALAFLVEAIVGAWQSRRAARRFQEEGQPA